MTGKPKLLFRQITQTNNKNGSCSFIPSENGVIQSILRSGNQ